MPKVSNLPGLQKDYTIRKFGQKPGPLQFVNQLESIEVKLFECPTPEQFRNMIAITLGNTWNDRLQYEFSEEEKDRMVDEVFRGELLPTALEYIGINWTVAGLDLIGTTHLIRHRVMSFSSQCHGDRDTRDDRVMVKPGIMANPEFFERYKKITEDARDLYVDMLDSGLVNGLDARTILPRNLEHFYVVKTNIRDAIGYVKMRLDEQIQTTEDNVVALKLWLEILKLYPWLKPYVDVNAPASFYVGQCKKQKRNIFPPNERNDAFDWSEEQFYHPIGRDEFPGGESYLAIRESILKEIEAIEPKHWRA